jgi:hypothetical protein
VLPPFVIEQIRRRERVEQARREAERPRIELPIDRPPPPESSDQDDRSERGVVILEF